MNSKLSSKQLSPEDLKSRASKPANYELENRWLRKLSTDFAVSLHEGLNALGEMALEICHNGFVNIDIPSLNEKILLGAKPSNKAEVLSVSLAVSNNESGTVILGNNSDVKLDYEDYRILRSLIEIASTFIQLGVRKNLKAENNKLEAVFNDSPAALAMFRGREVIFEKINDRWLELVGPRDYIGRTYNEVYPELINSGQAEAITNVFETGETFHVKEKGFLVDAGDGKLETRFYDFSYVRILDEEGRPYGVFCHGNNVTENKKRSEFLKSTLEARDMFMRIASHELNTPLTSIKLQAQMRKKALLKKGEEILSVENNLEFFNHTLFQVGRLSLLVNDMLDVEKINSGRFNLNKQVSNLSNLLRDTAERSKMHLESIGCQVVSDIENDVMVNIDPLRIDQVTTNLLTNAKKYAGKGNIILSLKSVAGFAVVSIADEGIGIALQDQSRIFKRYERVNTEVNMSGMGLGLFISEQIITSHQGIIGVISEKGKGATFYYKIPLAELSAKKAIK